MHSVLIVVHLFVAIGLVSVILLQRSEGGALGMGGGPGGLMTGRQAGNVLTRTTAALAVAFLITSVTLTLLTNAGSGDGSVVDRVNPNEITAPLIPSGGASAPVLDEGPAPSEAAPDLQTPPAETPATPAPAAPDDEPPAP